MTAGCAVSTPPRVYTVQSAVAFPRSAGIDPAGPDEGVEPARYENFKRLLTSALQAQGIAIEQESANRLAIAISERPASLGVVQTDRQIQLPAPRRHHFYDACRARRFDAVIVLRDVSTGMVRARWHGGFDACEIDDARISAMAVLMARALTAR